MIQRFLRNKVVEVEPQPDGTLVTSWRLTDDLVKAEVRLTIQLPEMEILEADAAMERLIPGGCESASEEIKKVEGISVGGGLRKIVAGLLGGPGGCSIISTAVLESANAIILHFTRPNLQSLESADPDKKLAVNREMVKSNPRLIRSCIVFQDDSPIMQGVIPEEETK
jgi:hypothetical protein